MIIDDDKLEILVQKVLSDERERIYNSWFCEGDIVTPILEIKQSRFRKKSTVYMDLGVWENFQSEIKELLQALYYAHKRLEYFEEVQNQEIPITFDEYIRKNVFDYDTAAFERMRNRVEELYYVQTDDER